MRWLEFTTSAILTWLIAGFLIALVLGAILVRVLPHFRMRQTAYEDAPKSHVGKTGTPTMGGLAILAALLPAWFSNNRLTLVLLGLIFACAAIGLLDDYLGILKGRNRGLRARTKYLATALIATVFLRVVAQIHGVPVGTIFHAGSASLTVPFWLWLILGIIAITGTVHAVNLTDGLDGLAIGTIVPPLVVLAAIVLRIVAPAFWSVVLLLAIGACLGFLVYNRYPAKMFMGDTGSLALGALLSGAAILSGEMLLLILIGGVFVAEALSVIIQVAYFKKTRKRIFRMSPLHHHFELGGMREPAVTVRFWVASALCSLVGWAIVR